MSFRAIVALALGLALMAGTAFAQSIDIFTYNSTTQLTDFGSCQGTATPFAAPTSIRVYGRLGGAVQGLSGAELFIKANAPGAGGAPVDLAGLGWTVSVTPNPSAATTVGNPIVTTTPPAPELPYKRGNIVFAVNPDGTGCQTGDAGAPAGLVLLYTIQMFNFGTGTPIPSNTYLTVGAGDPPSNPTFACPLFTDCNYPTFPSFCVRGGTYILNPVGRSCSVAVNNETWSGVKALYR